MDEEIKVGQYKRGAAAPPNLVAHAIRGPSTITAMGGRVMAVFNHDPGTFDNKRKRLTPERSFEPLRFLEEKKRT